MADEFGVAGARIADVHTLHLPLQLVPGIKGTLSVVELKVLTLGLLQGMEAKARLGELVRILPPGYVTDATVTVVTDPNLRVQEATASRLRVRWSTWKGPSPAHRTDKRCSLGSLAAKPGWAKCGLPPRLPALPGRRRASAPRFAL